MFKKLRNKFLVLNLVTISVMMLIAFSTIYFITYKNVTTDIEMKLRKIPDINQRQNDGKDQPHPGFENSQPPPDRSISFTLVTDSKWNITTKSFIFEMDDVFYESAKKVVLSKGTDSGSFKLDGSYWSYMIKPYFDGYRIVFLDTTSQHGILMNLIYTFLIVAFVMLIFIYFISRFFANKSIKPVQEAFDKQKQFIADASHELKTPLSVINTNVDVLLSYGEDSVNNQSKWLYYIKSEAERMAKLTNDLLYLTQVDYSDMKMVFSDFNISEAVETVILTMEAVIYENNITLKYDIEPDMKTHGNIEQIKQIVMILLDNALKYTNSKGTVDITLKKSHNNIMLSVTNTGEGIAEEHIDKIFNRFYRPDKSRARKNGGYGLGLAIAKAIIEQHSGKIYVKSIVNESTTFYVELPRVS